MGNCKNCKFFDGRYCDLIEVDDDDYPHNNHEKVGVKVDVSDDSGLDVRMRVSGDFGCVLFKERNSNGKINS